MVVVVVMVVVMVGEVVMAVTWFCLKVLLLIAFPPYQLQVILVK